MKVKKVEPQSVLLRRSMKRLDQTKRELADALGVSPATVDAWLAPEDAGRHRTMPKTAKLALAAILAAKK